MKNIEKSSEGRIINVSSRAHKRTDTGGLNLDDLNHEKSYSAMSVYGASKLSNIYFTRQLASNFESRGVRHVKTASLHPGVVRTELLRYVLDAYPLLHPLLNLLYPLFYMVSKSPFEGA